MPKVSPEVLKWARETAGLTPEDAAHKIGFRSSSKSTASDKLSLLEEGTNQPSRSQLSKMADAYRRPLIALYLDEPPVKADRGADFRRTTDHVTPESEARVDALVRDVKARQSMMRDALEEDEDMEPVSFIGTLRTEADIQEALTRLHGLLNMDHNEYYRAKGTSASFTLLRNRVESLGVFVLLKGNLGSYHTAFSTKDFRGFSLADNLAPFIIINDQDSPAAWPFTLLHELVHLLRGESGIGNSDTSSQTEQFCERTAGALLLPVSELQLLTISSRLSVEQNMHYIADFALERNLSRLMVAYNALQAGLIDSAAYLELDTTIRAWRERDRESQRVKLQEAEGGPSFYVVRRHRLGKRLLESVRQSLSSESLSTSKAATILGVNPGHVHKLLTV